MPIPYEVSQEHLSGGAKRVVTTARPAGRNPQIPDAHRVVLDRVMVERNRLTGTPHRISGYSIALPETVTRNNIEAIASYGEGVAGNTGRRAERDVATVDSGVKRRAVTPTPPPYSSERAYDNFVTGRASDG